MGWIKQARALVLSYLIVLFLDEVLTVPFPYLPRPLSWPDRASAIPPRRCEVRATFEANIDCEIKTKTENSNTRGLLRTLL